MMTDPLGDMLTRIRNAQMRGMTTSHDPGIQAAWPRARCARPKAAIRGYAETKDVNGHPAYEISLKYYDGTPVIRELKRVSKPGRRVYLGVDDIPQVRQGLGVSIVSTSKGVMTDASARSHNVGGEVLCTLF